MAINYKLFALPLIVLFLLVYMSFVFSSEVERLKEKIDNIYFGNFIPVHKLHIIKEEYNNIIVNIHSNANYRESRNIIIANWEYYNNQYKTKHERRIVKKINNQVKLSFKKRNVQFYKYIINQVNLLIEYEVSEARAERKKFLVQYEKIRRYLFYNQIFIVTFIVLFIIGIILMVIRNNNKMEHLIDKYKVDSITDGLTGVYNRKYFDKIFSETLILSKQNKYTSAFVMIDIDFFKQFNDTYGHAAGDIALQMVATALKELFQNENEYIFRLGGEEFGLIIRNIKRNALEKKLQKIEKNIAEQEIVHKASQTSFLTVSMGVILIDKESYSFSEEDIYKLADKKLYQSKQNGRNQYTL